jgi:hypothetical protein
MEAGTNGTRMLPGQSIITPLPSVNSSHPGSIEEETVEPTTVVPVGLLSNPGGTAEAPPTEGAAVLNPPSDVFHQIGLPMAHCPLSCKLFVRWANSAPSRFM